jgi:hypothetical protein
LTRSNWQNIAPWLDYFWGALLCAYKEFEARVATIERGRGAKGDRVRAEILKHNESKSPWTNASSLKDICTSFLPPR